MNSRSAKLVTLAAVTISTALLCSCSEGLCPTYITTGGTEYLKMVPAHRIELPYTDKYKISMQKKYMQSRKRLLSASEYRLPSRNEW
jgi:hypothetical protein